MAVQEQLSQVYREADILYGTALDLLKKLISTPSFSKEEDRTANIIYDFLFQQGASPARVGNNVYAVNESFDSNKPTILLNSHHDTVKPNNSFTLDPFTPIEKDDKLFGLGSTDAGGALVSLLVTFLHYRKKKSISYNLVVAATAEEEISGKGGIEQLLSSHEFRIATGQKENPVYGNWSAIVGEPTNLQLAIAERGLMVLDCVSEGKAGHAAREEGDNAVYKAMEDIRWFRDHKYERVSELLGEVKQNVTVIETDNKTHNIVPANCSYVADIRINELYTFEEILSVIRKNVNATVIPRSTRLRSTFIKPDHPVVKAGVQLGSDCYGSPTTSDKALIPFPALKVGPGDSARSHSANEFIYTDEIRKGIKFYIEVLNQLL